MKLYTNEKSSYLTNNTVSSVGPRPNCGPLSTFHWAAQNLLWAVIAALIAWNQTWATVITIYNIDCLTLTVHWRCHYRVYYITISLLCYR